MPIKINIGLITFIKITTLSYHVPKNTGTNACEILIIPNIIGNAKKNTNLKYFISMEKIKILWNKCLSQDIKIDNNQKDFLVG